MYDILSSNFVRFIGLIHYACVVEWFGSSAFVYCGIEVGGLQLGCCFLDIQRFTFYVGYCGRYDKV